jgi:hypothetical protein
LETRLHVTVIQGNYLLTSYVGGFGSFNVDGLLSDSSIKITPSGLQIGPNITTGQFQFNFTPGSVSMDWSDSEAAAQFVGTYRLDAAIDPANNIIYWRAYNDTDINSFLAGSTWNGLTGSSVPNVSHNLPYGTIRQYIYFETTLTGASITPSVPAAHSAAPAKGSI